MIYVLYNNILFKCKQSFHNCKTKFFTNHNLGPKQIKTMLKHYMVSIQCLLKKINVLTNFYQVPFWWKKMF